MSASRVTGQPSSAGRSRVAERRSYWIAGVVLFAAIAGLTAVSVFTTSTGPRKDTTSQLAEQGGAKPHIIPRPDEGSPPKHPNDRGGWEQFLVLGLIVVGLLAVFLLARRSSLRARRAASLRQVGGAAGQASVDGQPT